MASTKGLKPGDRRYNADKNEWEVKEKKTKPTPASNTRKKAAKAGKPAADKPKAKKAKAPVPRPRSDRPSKSRKPGDAREYSSFDKKSSSGAPVPRPRSERPSDNPKPKYSWDEPGFFRKKLKGKVADLPSKKKAAMTASADAKVRADAAREERIKKSKGSAADMVYAYRTTGRKAW
jgi:hypothetical protein